ncbi:MAG: hypothetical protein PHU43_03630 [Candidatus Bipolaricaulis sp.]|nr:hypothetical protein [Candidatus Bipolaricaulis sp.]
MHRMCAQWAALIALLLAASGAAAAGDLGFSADIGLEVTYAPVPPASYDITSGLTLAFAISGVSLASETEFSLAGFSSECMTIGADLGAVRIGEEIRFEPYFAWNDLSFDLSIVGIEIGMQWIFADIGGPQTPSYSMGTVFRLASSLACGFSITSLTGFGATGLVNLLDGVLAPFSHELLCVFEHLDALCEETADLDVTIVDGFYFEEELVRLEADYLGMMASGTTWFDAYGLSSMLFELGYRFDDPTLRFLTSMALDGTFGIVGAGFILDLEIETVRFTSHTMFAAPVVPTLIPIAFDGQRFGVSFEVCGVLVTSSTDFDDAFLFSRELIGIEAAIGPVTFASLTTFDASGFAEQRVCAGVTFSGVVLFTHTEFDVTGIQLVTFGFHVVI